MCLEECKAYEKRIKLSEPEGNVKILPNDPVRFLYRLTVNKRGMVSPSGFLVF